MKKLLALTMAGVMLFSTPIMAAEDEWEDGVEDEWEEDENEENQGSPSPSAPAVKPSPPKTEIPAKPDSEAPAVAASSVSSEIIAAAAAEGKTVGEYMNNAVVTVPGLDYAIPVGQGGHVIINGAPSNQVFSVLKPALANVYTAKAYAAALGGRVLSVVRVNANIKGFQTARVNFYTKGVWGGQNIKVFQIVNGQCYELHVAEIRTDHVVVDMTSLGTLAFIEVPNK